MPGHRQTSGRQSPQDGGQPSPQAADQPSGERRPDGTRAAPATDDRAQQARVGRSAALMSVLVIVSRITGILRTQAQSIALGITVISSCYAVANTLPNSLYEIVVGGMLVTAFLPVYLSVKRRVGERGASEYTSNLLTIVLVAMGVVTLASFVFASQVIWTQTFSVPDTSEFDFDLAIYFYRFFAIEVVLYALSSIFSGVLNAERDYLWSNAAPIFNNVITIASFVLYIVLSPSAPGLALVIVALGNPLGVAVQVLVQMPGLRRHGIRLRLRIDLSDPALKETLSIGIPTLVVMLCSFVTSSVMNSTTLEVTPVGASVSYYARMWFTLPYAVLVVPITTAMFTELSDSVATGDMATYRRGVIRGTSEILFLSIPFMLYLVVFARYLCAILVPGNLDGDFGLVVLYLQWLAVSLPAYGINTYLQKVCSALRRMGVYAVAHVVAAAIQTLICLTLPRFFGLVVIPLSSTVYMLAVDVVTFVMLRRQLGQMGLRSVLVACARGTLLGAAGAAVGFVILQAMPLVTGPFMGSITHAIMLVITGGVPAVLVTFGLAFALKMPEVDAFRGLLARLRRH